MRVKCILTNVKEFHIKMLGDFYREQEFGITVGKEYLVLGMDFHINVPHFGTGIQIQIFNDYENIAHAPLFLFEICDGRPSKYWESRFYEDGSLSMQPPSFYKPFYHDHLADGKPDIVEDFEKVQNLLESEYQKLI